MEKYETDIEQQVAIAELYESCFIEAIQEQAEQKKFKKGDFAQDVWPESSPIVARHRWENMRFGDQRTGKPKTCSMSDAYRMVKALGLQMPYVTLVAEYLLDQKLKEMESAQREPAKPEPPRRGRKKREGDKDSSAE